MERTLDQQRPSVRTFGLSWPLIVALLTLVDTLGFGQSRPLGDPDTYWHIAAGRWILQHLAVPTTDPFSHSMPGAPWIAHEWLSEVVLAATYSVAGWPGLVAITALAVAGTLAHLTRFLLYRMEPAHALLLTTLAGSMLAAHLLARPHVLTWPLMAIWIGTLVDAAERRRDPPWWTLALIVLWANLHGGVSVGTAVGAAIALEAVLAMPPDLRRPAARRWAGFVALSVAAMMATPAGWRSLWFTFHLMGPDVMLEVIGEWRSADFHRPQPLELWLLLVLGVALAGRLRLPWLRLLLLLGLVHLALAYGRSVAVLGLISPFLMAAPLARQWSASQRTGRDVESLDRLFRSLAAPARPGATLTVSFIGLLAIVLATQSTRFSPPPDRTPEAAVAAALDAGQRGPVLNDYNFGGYLIFRGIPVFIDGRADLYRRPFMERMFRALEDREELARVISDFRIDWTLLRPGTPAIAILDTTPCWRRVHADSIAVAHVRVECEAVR